MNQAIINQCYRGIIQYLNGNIGAFRQHIQKAKEIQDKHDYMVTIGDIVPVDIKEKLYELVA